MNGTARIVCGALVGLAAGAPLASADETRAIRLAAQGTAVAQCPGSGTPPSCSGPIVRINYADPEVSGEPFSDFVMYREPALLSGHLDVPASAFAAGGSCASVTGVFELSTRRGMSPRPFLAFAEAPVSGSYCPTSSGGSLHASYTVDTSEATDPKFRGAVGAGQMLLADSINLVSASGATGSFSWRDDGHITMRR